MDAIEQQHATEELLRRLATIIDGTLEGHLGKMGFALVVFEFDKPGLGNYISNAQRADMITALRELADRLESRSDIPATPTDHETVQ